MTNTTLTDLISTHGLTMSACGVDGPDGAPVADTKMRQSEQSQDNARLIAAAPDLLIALTTMVMNYEDAYGDEGADAPESVKAAKVAIRKATSP